MKMLLNNKTILFLAILFTAASGFAQTTAREVVKEAAKKDSIEQTVTYLKKTVSSLQTPSEKRSAYAFLGGVQEQLGQFSEALSSYAQAASIAAGDAEGMAKKSSEQLVIDAVRCALSAGDWSSAQNYLNSPVRNSTNSTIIAYVKLYEQWSILCKANTVADTTEAVAMLKTYSALESMKAVHPQLLLTLWHVTGEASYSDTLKKNFAKTPEAAIVKGEIQTMPAPFWYFVPRKATGTPEVEAAETKVSSAATKTAVASGNAGTVLPAEKKVTEKTEDTSNSKTEKIVKQQLGLFRDKGNAEGLVSRLKEKGFTAKIAEEKRPSGTTYYLVVVDENKAGTMGDELRTAGFECYPVFE